MYEWLEQEVAEVHWDGYFVFEQRPLDQLSRRGFPGYEELPAAYRAFLEKFGWARLFRSRGGSGGYLLIVYGHPDQANLARDGTAVRFGSHDDAGAYFKWEDVERDADHAPVYEETYDHRRLVRVADDFESWLRARWAKQRKKLGRRRWAELVAGPAPFTPEERDIVEARKRFAVRRVGVADDGDTIIEVYNGSNRRLDRLSVGARSKDDGLHGVLFFDVRNIAPGERRTLHVDCYKAFRPADAMEIFDRLDPTPATRDDYAELRALNDHETR